MSLLNKILIPKRPKGLSKISSRFLHKRIGSFHDFHSNNEENWQDNSLHIQNYVSMPISITITEYRCQ